MLKCKTIEEAKLIKDKDIAAILDLPPIKLHCSVLAEGSIRKAIEDWEKPNAHPNLYGDGKASEAMVNELYRKSH